MAKPVGKFALVLHSHLPWLAHHGSWPVGEEWLYQSWSSSYLRVFDVLGRLADEGHENLVTLGITPVLAAQLDDEHCLNEFSTWLGFWEQRAHQLAQEGGPAFADVAAHEVVHHNKARELFEDHWRSGGSPVIRRLVDAGVVEVLSGPAAHTFQPLLDDELVDYGLRVGRADSKRRIGNRSGGVWAPECGYRPGLEDIYAANGVTHFMVDGPTLRHVGCDTSAGWRVGDSDVIAFGRDLEVTYRVWSPRKGYPGGQWYRDFHSFHEASGLHHVRVTSRRTPPGLKRPYDPAAAQRAIHADARDFVRVVRERLIGLGEHSNSSPLVVAGYDTELFGHWWHEGPEWLEQVLRLLPEAGVEVTTLDRARRRQDTFGQARIEKSSWGSNKDFSVWAGPHVSWMVDDNDALQRQWRKLASDARSITRDPVLDQLARNALLALSSDWAFMVTKDSAADYARARHNQHHQDFRRLAKALELARDGSEKARRIAVDLAADQRRRNGPFGNLDGRFREHETR